MSALCAVPSGCLQVDFEQMHAHLGKLQAWSAAGGAVPEELAALEAERRARHPERARDPLWRGDLPDEENGKIGISGVL